VPAAPGANDNASGAASVIELARAFSAAGETDGLCFATFGAEESGLHGSAALVARMSEDGELPGAMVNLDVTGVGERVEVIGSADLVQRALDIAEEKDIPAVASSLPANTGSDHQPFLDAGVPVLYFTSGDFSNIHTPRDSVDQIDEAELGRIGTLAFEAIKDLLPTVAPG
jgi:aminopeptidase YwaD